MGVVGETFVSSISYGGNYTLKSGFIHQTDIPVCSKHIELITGFQFISLPLEPQQKDLESIFSEILDKVDFIKDSNGSFFRKIGNQWIDNIGTWTPQTGYLIKMKSNATLTIQGIPVQHNFSIVLNQGYIIVPYYGYSNVAIEVFGDILDNLNFARNSKGQMLRIIGSNWIDNIGQLNEGEACLLKMKQQDMIHYDNQATRKRSINNRLKENNSTSRHFESVIGNPAEPTWSIYIETAIINDISLEPGDEIAVFDGDLLVGTMMVSEVLTQETRFNHYITVWSKLNDGTGYTVGHPCSIVFWDDSEHVEYGPVSIDFVDMLNSYSQNIFPEGDGQFSIAGLSYSQLFAEMLTDASKNTHSDAIPVTLMFSSEIDDLQPTESLVNNGRIHDFTRHSSTTYYFTVSPADEGELEIKLSDTFVHANNLTLRTPLYLMYDCSPPVISILGEPTVYIFQGDEYIDPGAKAIDNSEGNISNVIVTDNPVNAHKPGEYRITYTASDLSGNQAIAERWVFVDAVKTYHGYIKANDPQTGEPVPQNNVMIYIVDGDQEAYSISTFTITDETGNKGYFRFKLPEYGRPYQLMAILNGYISSGFSTLDQIDQETDSDVYFQDQVLEHAKNNYIRGVVSINTLAPDDTIYVQAMDESGQYVSQTMSDANGTFFMGLNASSQEYTLTAYANEYSAISSISGDLPLTNVHLNLIPGTRKRLNSDLNQNTVITESDTGGSCFIGGIASNMAFSWILLPWFVCLFLINRKRS